MKKISVLVLSLLTLPVHAQAILGILNQHQSTLHPSSQSGSPYSSTTTTAPEVIPSNEQTVSDSNLCESPDQTSMPLAYVTSLIQAENGQLEITHDQRAGKLSITAPDMIGNCSTMLQWTLKRPVINDQKAYALEVKFKQGEGCSENGCSYKIAKVEKGEFQKFETMTFKPTLKGFEECLEKSGVIKNGKVDAGAIYNNPVNQKFDNAKESGKFYFLSNGPQSKQVKPRYGKFQHVVGCDHYESAHPSINSLLSYEDAERQRLDEEAAKLGVCNEYGKITEFIEKYESYESDLSNVRDSLILKAAENAAKAIEKGNATEEDLKVIEDFDRYIVQPKIAHARKLYQDMLELEGEAKKKVHDDLVKVLKEISDLGKKPYFLSSHTLKLINAGKFEDAEKLNNLKLTIEHHQRLGSKQENVLITPDLAAKRINKAKASFAVTLEIEREKYEYKTGQTTGNASRYRKLAKAHRRNIDVRTKNYTAEIQLEYERMQQGGYCYKYYRNTQKCLQDSVERIEELQVALAKSNEFDSNKAEEYDELATDWGKLEAQGRRHIAHQTGEDVPEEDTDKEDEDEDSKDPVNTNRRREEDERPQSPYTFQWNGGQQMPQQQPVSPYQYNNMFMQQQSPYGYQQQNYMGQQMYQQTPYMQSGGTPFNWTGGGYPQQGYQQQPYQQYGYPQQQQMPYYNQPYQAYGNYNLYGGVRW